MPRSLTLARLAHVVPRRPRERPCERPRRQAQRAVSARRGRNKETQLASNDVLTRLAGLEEEYHAVEASLADPAVIADQHRLRDASRRYKELQPVVDCY